MQFDNDSTRIKIIVGEISLKKENLMWVRREQIIRKIIRLQQNELYQLVQKSLNLLFPFVLIGSISQLIQITMLNRNSLLPTIFGFSSWLSRYRFIEIIFDHLTSLTLGIVAALAAFSMAHYTAKRYQRDEKLASITGLIAYLILTVRYTNNGELAFGQDMLGMGGLFLGFLVGYLVGLSFKHLANSQQQDKSSSGVTWNRALDSLRAIIIVLVVAICFSILLNWLAISVLPDQVILRLQSLKANQTSLLFSVAIVILAGIMTFFGLTSMPILAHFGRNGVAMTANLNYALIHHTIWGVPYPFSLGTLYESFGAIGGTGSTLSLVIAIFLFSNQRDQQLIGRWSLLPVLFNFNSAILVGVPVLGNGLYIIPFLLVPLVNVGIAASAIALHLMPAVVYQVPLGTPSLLQALIGTNGNWVTLLVMALNVGIGVWLYRPFVKLSNRLNIQGDGLDATER